MPVHSVEVPHDLRYVQVLDQDGNLDKELEPAITDEELRALYRAMLLARTFDDRRLKLQRQGRIGTFAPVQGQEAAQLGSVYALRPTDWVVPSYREVAALLWRGHRMEDELRYAGGHDDAVHLAEDARELPVCIPVASQLPHAVGLAWAMRLQGRDDVVLAYHGDGATSSGDFHEALNWAGLFQVPLVVVCQDNQWAISVPRRRQTRSATLAQKAFAYDIPGVQVDGNDVLAVLRVTREAVERARRGDGPTLIEAITYRMGPHTTADDPSRYRDEEEVQAWAERDPIKRFRVYLRKRGAIDNAADERLRDEVDKEVERAVDRFETSRGAEPETMFDHVWAEVPPHVVRQRDALTAYLDAANLRDETGYGTYGSLREDAAVRERGARLGGKPHGTLAQDPPGDAPASPEGTEGGTTSSRRGPSRRDGPPGRTSEGGGG